MRFSKKSMTWSALPAREAKSSEGKGGVTPGARASGFPHHPSRGLHPGSPLRHYPTASCGAWPPPRTAPAHTGAAPCAAVASSVQRGGARQCAEVTLRRLVAVVLAIAGLTLIFIRRCRARQGLLYPLCPHLGPIARPTLPHAGRACWPPSWPAQEAPPVVARLSPAPILMLDRARRPAI